MILANGCSYTQGYDFEDLSLSWPYQLGKIINQPVTNLALGGGSNDRILRTTIEYFVKHRPSLVIIGWTEYSRNELSHHQGCYVRATSLNCLAESVPIPTDLDHIHREWLTYSYNRYINYRSWIYSVLHIEMLCNALNIPCKFFSAFGNNYINEFNNETNASQLLADKNYQWSNQNLYTPPEKSTHSEWQELTQLCKQINLNNWILKNSQTMQTYLKSKKYAMNKSNHFFADGHKCWAELIATELQ
jgi:hypothetical protein